MRSTRPIKPADLPDPPGELPPWWRGVDWAGMTPGSWALVVGCVVVAVAVVMVVGWVAWQMVGGAMSSPSNCAGWADCYG